MSDAERIEQMRAKRAEARRVRDLEVYPRACLTCFAAAGERCITITGGRTARHPLRAPRRT